MTLDYFYGQAGELFSFFRIPKALFQEQRFQDLSTDAKTLYGILLDRMSLSVRNEWFDKKGRVFIIFTIEDVKRTLRCADNKATRLLRELEEFGLIERKRRGQGKPCLVYAKLVFRNAKRSVKDYLIYIVTMTICVTLFYSFLSISSRYYQPDIGSEYNFTILSDGMKAAICVITLFLLFLIRFVNHYMLRRKHLSDFYTFCQHLNYQLSLLQCLQEPAMRVIGYLFDHRHNMCKYHAVPNTQLKDRLYLHSILWEIEEMQSHYQIHQHLLLSQLHHGKKLPKLLFYLIHTLPYANTSSETK